MKNENSQTEKSQNDITKNTEKSYEQSEWNDIGDLEGEAWRDVVGYEGIYQVSNLGRVKSLDRRNHRKHAYKGKIKKLTDLKGYKAVRLCKTGSQNTSLVHRLVAACFIPNAKNLPDINHKNCIKSDNRVENLEWISEKDNTKHAILNGRMNHLFGENNSLSKLTIRDVNEIRGLYLTGKYTHQEISKIYGVKKSVIGKVVNNTNWYNEEYGKLIINGINTSAFKRNKGENNGASKLTRSLVETIRKLHITEKRTLTSLSIEFGVSRGCIAKIIRFKTWK